ncbi:uncharacterized protein BDCG_17966 [Blastomyces dermatitidis ER-3]|uniref:Uncharacterized protein n=1 Tax=Ajellomyces dermatitidis (strain ER-3 / ATCC MYA-2586) TaxID=559297 RepID=A0ABX2W1B8_AJEDR|nr:uncharacterized protein BDCG_17966 [Blastomyces dermatitidis ER-3]OAT03178.1 hypothetical protein BDCG_17966 [Blastomyces dermatitidis ER-3]
MRSYITVLTEREGGVATVMRGVKNRLNTDELISRRDDTSLQGTVTTTAAAKEAGEEEDVTMRAVLPRLIDTAISNLAFLIVMKATATP